MKPHSSHDIHQSAAASKQLLEVAVGGAVDAVALRVELRAWGARRWRARTAGAAGSNDIGWVRVHGTGIGGVSCLAAVSFTKSRGFAI